MTEHHGGEERDLGTDLAAAFAGVARTLLAEPTPEATLSRIVQLAVEVIDGCEHCGISIVKGSSVASPVCNDAVPALVDRLQSETGEGPCIDAIRHHEVFQTGHLSRENRWPHIARRASQESGIESILSFRLFSQRATPSSC